MKKTYIKPEIEVLNFKSEGLIANSLTKDDNSSIEGESEFRSNKERSGGLWDDIDF